MASLEILSPTERESVACEKNWKLKLISSSSIPGTQYLILRW